MDEIQATPKKVQKKPQRMHQRSEQYAYQEYIYDTSDSVSIDKAIEEARKRWPKQS